VVLLGFLTDSKVKQQSIGKFIYFILIGFIGYSLLFNLLPWHFERIVFPPDMTIRNDISPTDTTGDAIKWLRENTNKNEKILVIGNSIVYIKADRLPSTRPSHSVPFSWVPFPKVKEEILSTPPSYLLIDTNFTSRLKGAYHQMEMYDFANNFMPQCFKEVYEVDTWKILKNNCISKQ
ncbi:hypothetical protein KW795_00440, partial [Candidatus Microgenomates bacterium]|nr:hypothetical protein [Candidatus Microgenomates bacterium]